MAMVRLELAPTVEAANRFMRAWQVARKSWQQDLDRAQAWDTWLISSYAPLFTLLCWAAADHFSVRFPRVGTVGYTLAGMQLLAGGMSAAADSSRAVQKHSMPLESPHAHSSLRNSGGPVPRYCKVLGRTPEEFVNFFDSEAS